MLHPINPLHPILPSNHLTILCRRCNASHRITDISPSLASIFPQIIKIHHGPELRCSNHDREGPETALSADLRWQLQALNSLVAQQEQMAVRLGWPDYGDLEGECEMVGWEVLRPGRGYRA